MDRPTQPHPTGERRLIRIEVTVVLPRRLVWLLAGIAVSNLQLPEQLLDRVLLLLRALPPG